MLGPSGGVRPARADRSLQRAAACCEGRTALWLPTGCRYRGRTLVDHAAAFAEQEALVVPGATVSRTNGWAQAPDRPPSEARERC